MCRYAFKEYKPHFACFECRKTFKKVAMWDYFSQRGMAEVYDLLFSSSRGTQRYMKCVKRYGTDGEGMKAEYLVAVSTCPNCASKMSPVGLDFRAPQRDDREGWAIMQSLYEHGFAFVGCGCSVNYSPPDKLSEVPEFLRRYAKMRSDGERLLESISRRLAV